MWTARYSSRCAHVLAGKGAVFVFVLHNRPKAREELHRSDRQLAPEGVVRVDWNRERESGARTRVRRAYGSQASEVTTRLTDETCVTPLRASLNRSSRPRDLRTQPSAGRRPDSILHTSILCILLENARAGRGKKRGQRGEQRCSEALI